MRKVKYRVTGAFGDSDEGEVRDAYVIPGDGPFALLYHPGERDLCASLEFCEEGGDGVFVSCYEGGWINLERGKRMAEALTEIAKAVRPKNARE